MGLFVALALVALGWWIMMLVDALKRPTAEWESAGLSQIVWVVVILFASFLGGLLYWFIARPQMEAQTV